MKTKILLLACGAAALFALETGYSIALRGYDVKSNAAFFKGPVTATFAALGVKRNGK